ncbi:MAG: efflux RND transporter periplasmic adaptor subunit [Candidatus Aminicenantes bacterium]|nr:efflux RND transporter periplasmic adaptor subunit [Candidatus Aminicenantes bacterium]
MVFPKKILTIFLAVVIVGALVFYLIIKKGAFPDNKEEKSADARSGEKQEVRIPVKTAPAARGDLIIKLRSPGEAVTDRKIDIKAEVEGVVEHLDLHESQHVKKGDVLLELDDERYRLDYENAEATRLKTLSELILDQQYSEVEKNDGKTGRIKADGAKKRFQEAGRLFQKGLISRDEYEKQSQLYERALIESGERKDEVMAAMKGLTQAEINVKKALLNLGKTKIRAPFSGIVTGIKVSPGENIVVGRELFTLVDVQRIRVHAQVLESEIGKMKVGREVVLKFSAYPGKMFGGRVAAISPLVDPEDKTCRVIVDVKNPDEAIKPGMHAEVEIPAEIHKNRLLVPQDAVLTRSGRKLLFVVEGEVAKWRYIEVGLENEEYAEVLDGVKDGEQVIVEGHFTLAHDARVKVENAPNEAP